MPNTTFRNSALFAFLVFVVSFACLLTLSFQRFVAFDEGFYLLAGKMVAEGNLPYLDFFYPQMPLLPFLHAVWIRLLGPDWYVARIVTVLFASGTFALLFLYLQRTITLSLALLAWLLIISQTEVLAWFTVAKTYAYSSLPLMLCTVLTLFATEKRGDRWRVPCFLAAGLSLGVTIDIRLFYVILIPVFLLFILLKSGRRFQSVLAFCAGGSIAALPHLYFAAQDFDSYWFNNVGYHLVRSHRSPEVDHWSKWNIFLIVSGLKGSSRIDGLGLPLLVWGNFLLCLSSLATRRFPPLPALLGLALFAMYFLPDPVHVQYFSTCVPLFVFGLVLGLQGYRFGRSALLFLLILSLLSLPSGLDRLIHSGEGLKGIDQETKNLFTLKKISEKSGLLDSSFPSGSIVISQWPGFLFATTLQPAAGLENQFWIRMDKKLSDEQVMKYKLMTTKILKDLPSQPEIRGIVIEERKLKRYTSPALLKKEGFVLSSKTDGLLIYDNPQR